MTRPTKASPADGKPRIVIRMYRALDAQGDAYAGYLGDCFLIRVLNGDQAVANILIDFGILTGSVQAETRMRQIATDIVRSTGGEIGDAGQVAKKGSLDLLVITHEHWDHISGFSQAQDLMFDGLVIQKLWMAWTEDDNDATARQLQQERDQRSVALAALSEIIQKAAASLTHHRLPPTARLRWRASTLFWARWWTMLLRRPAPHLALPEPKPSASEAAMSCRRSKSARSR